MIEELKPDYYNNIQFPPEALVIMDKLNEVIRQVNTLTLDMQLRYLKEDRNGT